MGFDASRVHCSWRHRISQEAEGAIAFLSMTGRARSAYTGFVDASWGVALLGGILARSARRTAWPLALTSVVALAISSSAAWSACTFNSTAPPDGHVRAFSGDSCFALGTYSTATTGLSAGQASDGGVIFGTNNGDGFQGSVSFSTTAGSTPALQADTGGSININPGQYTATVTTFGEGSAGLFVTDEGRRSPRRASSSRPAPAD